MKKLTKKELVMLDDRFIRWLADYDGNDDYTNLTGKRYLEVSEGEGCYALHEYNSLKEIEKVFEDSSFEELDAWETIAIFDFKVGKEVKFEVVTKISFKK